MLALARSSGLPTPDSCRRCGEPTAPAARITSRAASAISTPPARERGAGATPAAAGLLAPTDAVAGAGRQVVDVRSVIDAEFAGRIDDRLAHRWPFAHRRGGEEPAPAVQLAVFALPALGLLEKRQYVV